MKDLKKQLCLRLDEMLLLFVLETGMFIVSQLIIFILLNIIGEKNDIALIPYIGTMIALFGTVLIILFMGMSTLSWSFNMGICMGTTRRRLIPMFFAATYAECLTATGLAYVLYRLQSWIGSFIYTKAMAEKDIIETFSGLSDVRYVFVASLAIVALQAIMGTLFLKYGPIAFWILWGAWILFCAGAPRIRHISDKLFSSTVGQAFFRLTRGLTENRVLFAIIVVSILVLLVSWLLLRKQQVNL